MEIMLAFFYNKITTEHRGESKMILLPLFECMLPFFLINILFYFISTNQNVVQLFASLSMYSFCIIYFSCYNPFKLSKSDQELTKLWWKKINLAKYLITYVMVYAIQWYSYLKYD